MRYIITALLFILCFNINTKAQNLLISTDYGNCGMGLKDSSGKWILEPHYDNIRRTRDFFYVEQGGKSGLVNRYGEIVIPVIYDNLNSEEIKDDFISEEGYTYRKITAIYFKAELNEKFGLLDTNNKVIVPIEYDFLNINNDNTFLVRQGKKHWGVFHPDGSYSDMHLHQKRQPVYRGCGLYSVRKTSISKLMHPFAYSGKSRHYKFGLINENGQTILKKKYSRIGKCEEQSDLIVTANKKQKIYYNQNGKELFRFDFMRNDWISSEWGGYSSFSTTINSDGYECVSLNKKFGIISKTGDTLLPFIYDYLNKTFITGSSPSAYIIRAEKDNLTGIYDIENRKWILQPEYESVTIINSYSNPADSSIVIFFRIEKNQKYSIVSSTGEVIIPFTIDAWSRDANEVFMLINNEPYQFSFPGYSNSISNNGKKSNESRVLVTEIPASGKFSQKTLKDGTILFLNPELQNDSTQLHYYKLFKSENTFDSLVHCTAFLLKKLEPAEIISPETKYFNYPSIIFIRDSIFPESQFITQQIKGSGENKIRRIYQSWKDKNYSYFKCNQEYIRSDGFSVLGNYNSINDKKAIIDSAGNFNIAVSTKKYKWGLVDYNGKLLIDTVWNDIDYAGENYYVVKKIEHYKRRKNYPDQYHYYNLIDASTGKLLLPEGYHSSAAPIAGYHCATVVRSKSGIGIYNFDQSAWAIQPVYNRIIKLDTTGKYFMVKTCSGKIGIVSWEGKWLADTSWTAMLNASYERNFSDQYDQASKSTQLKQTVVLSNAGKWLIFDAGTGKTSTEKADRDSLLFQTTTNIQLTEKKNISYTYRTWQRRCWNCPSIDTSKAFTDFQKIPDWQREILFDSLFAYQTFYYDTTIHRYANSSQCYCSEYKSGKKIELYIYQKEYASSTIKHKISFTNENCISVSRFGGYSKKHFTVMQFSDGPHAMLLDSLFTGAQWKSFLITEIMNYLNSHPGINGNCSNPAALPIILKNNFEIQAGGINLFMSGYYEKGTSLEILIPWEKLKPYLRADVMKKIGGE